jgi:NAD(P)H-hydrate epimerase
MKLFTAEEIQAIDQYWIEILNQKGEVLMEIAGREVSKVVEGFSPSRVFVLCGGGNNGGDGYVSARYLKGKGIPTTAIAFKDPSELKGSARWAYETWEKCGGVTAISPPPNLLWREILNTLTPDDLVVDALLGTGVKPPLNHLWVQLLTELSSFLEERKAPVVAVDIPSGIDPSTGEILAPPISAQITVTMGGGKIGLFIFPGAKYAGEVQVIDLGYPVETPISSSISVFLLEKNNLPTLIRPRDSHKGTFGVVGIVGGSKEMPGALALSATSALRSGVGKVIAITEEGGNRLLPPEVIQRILPPYKDLELSSLFSATEGVSSLLVGPGLGRDPHLLSLLKEFLWKNSIPTVIDADALYALPDSPVPGKNWILTPHEGEAGHLLKIPPREVHKKRLSSAKALLEKTPQGVVVLKGPGTIVIDSLRIAIAPFATPALSVPGSGDILSGLIAGILAQGLDLFSSATLGVYVHGKSGLLSPVIGNLAKEISDHFPEILKEFVRW